jgi:hypothetical protein
MEIEEVVFELENFINDPVYNKLLDLGKEGETKKYLEDSDRGEIWARQAQVGINQITDYFENFKRREPEIYKQYLNASEPEIIKLILGPLEYLPDYVGELFKY